MCNLFLAEGLIVDKLKQTKRVCIKLYMSVGSSDLPFFPPHLSPLIHLFPPCLLSYYLFLSLNFPFSLFLSLLLFSSIFHSSSLLLFLHSVSSYVSILLLLALTLYSLVLLLSLFTSLTFSCYQIIIQNLPFFPPPLSSSFSFLSAEPLTF